MSPSWKESHGQLPATIDLIQLAERGARLTGALPVKGMPRLAQICDDGSGNVFIDLTFERGEGEEVLLLHGTLHVRLRLTCQRCLEGMDLEFAASPWFILLRSGGHQDRLEEEPDILVADKPVSLNALVEDELLLALPMVPMHELSRCPARAHVVGETGIETNNTEQGRKNPFSVLSKLKKTK